MSVNQHEKAVRFENINLPFRVRSNADPDLAIGLRIAIR